MRSMPLTDSDRTIIKAFFLHLQYQQAIFMAVKAMKKTMKEAFLSVQNRDRLEFLKANQHLLPPEMSRKVKIRMPDYFVGSVRRLKTLGFDLERMAQLDDNAYDGAVLAMPATAPVNHYRHGGLAFYYDNEQEPIPLLNTYDKRHGVVPFSTDFESSSIGFQIAYSLTVPLDAIDHYPGLSLALDKLDALDNMLSIIANDIQRKHRYVSDAVLACRTTKQIDRLYPMVSDTLDYIYSRTRLSSLQNHAVIREAETVSEAVRQAVDILAETYSWPVVDSPEEGS